jgi:hypothetical protein
VARSRRAGSGPASVGALADGRHGLAEGRAALGVFGVSFVDVFDPVAALGLFAREPRPERARGDVVRALAQIAAADECVEGGQLADKVGEQVIELGAVAHPLDEGPVAVEQPLVIDVVQVPVVEIIALHAPGVGEHLAPLLPRVDRERPAREVHLFFREGGRSCGRGVDHVDLVVLLNEDLLPVGGQLVSADVLDNGLGLNVAVLDLEGLEAAPAVPVHEEQNLVRDGELGVVPRGQWHFKNPALKARELDRDFDARVLGLVGGGLVRFGRGSGCAGYRGLGLRRVLCLLGRRF